MLPKIVQKKPTIPYHCFAKQLMSHKLSENNISKLKLIKEFLDDQDCSFRLDRSVTQMKNNSDNDNASHQCPEEQRLKTIRKFYQKENETKTKKIRRQSLTAQTNMSQQLEKPKRNYQKSIFCVPDRFQLNGFLRSGRKKTVQIKDLLKPSLKIPNKVFTHRIL